MLIIKSFDFVSILLVASTCLLHDTQVVSSQQSCSTGTTSSWSILKQHPRLATTIESAIQIDNLKDGNHSFRFENWQENTLRLICPEKDSNAEYRWTQHCHQDDASYEECTKFDTQKYTSHRLIIPSPKRCGEHEKLFRTYVCETLTNGCKYYIHMVVRPAPITETHFSDQIALGSEGKFDCVPARCGSSDSILGPFTISWRGPNGLDLKENPLPHVTVKYEHDKRDENGDHHNNGRIASKSIVTIREATSEVSGIFECVLTSIRYGVVSTPDDRRTINETNRTRITDVYLKSGVRYSGFVYVHTRPTWFIGIPVSIIVLFTIILFFMIKFCPERSDEADVDADDDEDEIAAMKRSLKQRNSSSSSSDDATTTAVGSPPPQGKNGSSGLCQIQEEKESSSSSSRSSHSNNGTTTSIDNVQLQVSGSGENSRESTTDKKKDD